MDTKFISLNAIPERIARTLSANSTTLRSTDDGIERRLDFARHDKADNEKQKRPGSVKSPAAVNYLIYGLEPLL
jgi:hypothetical protein